MFASVRKYKVRRGSVEHLAQRVQDGFVPLVRQMDGFRGYYLLDGGPDVLITISIFDSSDAAFASNETAASWVETMSWSSRGACQKSWWAMPLSPRSSSTANIGACCQQPGHPGVRVKTAPRNMHLIPPRPVIAH